MPPRKKAKAPAPSLSPAPPSPWDDEQEIALLKSLTKWKPTGQHKHFRMISIHTSLSSHGFATEKAPHTRIPGIWAKLETLYDLATLDARENDFAFADEPDPMLKEDWPLLPDFALPDDEFGEAMWARRLGDSARAARASESPHALDPNTEDVYVPGLAMPHPKMAVSAPTPTTTSRAKDRDEASPAAAAAPARKTRVTRARRGKRKVESEEGSDESEEESESGDSAPTTRRAARGAGGAGRGKAKRGGGAAGRRRG